MYTEIIEKIYEEAKQKASNNKDRQAYIRPSEFGFESTCDGTRTCLELLEKDSRFKKVKMSGRDLLEITLYYEERSMENEAANL